MLDSALCMDKHFMKIVLQAAGVPVSPWVTVHPRALGRATRRACERMPRRLGEPVFVKPARAGSSVGVSKVHDASELAAALELAFAEDEKVLIEAAIVGREVEVAILEGRDGGGPRASLPGEIVLTTREFYDFEGKYLGGDGAEVVCPADLTDDEIAAVQELGIRAFEAVDGRGLARVDFFLDAGRALRERAQHDARLHADLDVPEVLDRVGNDVRRAHLGADRHRAGSGGARQAS